MAQQTFTAATAQLRLALAELEPWGSNDLPPAIIVDIDETLLLNTGFETRLVREGRIRDAKAWRAWVLEARAPPVPGAIEFLWEAAGLGVAVL